ncbi:MAG: hypothetical protein ACREQD_16450, partial [Candidatus Binataceae bacterium]
LREGRFEVTPAKQETRENEQEEQDRRNGEIHSRRSCSATRLIFAVSHRSRFFGVNWDHRERLATDDNLA